MKRTLITALCCLALAVAAKAQTKVVNYSYDAAGNRIGRVTVALPEQQTEPETAGSSSATPQKSSSAESSVNAGNQSLETPETIGNQTAGNPETSGNQTAGTPEAMPAKEETPAAVPSERQEGRQ